MRGMDNFYNNSIFGMESAKVFEDFKRKSDKALQHKFAGQIKGNFLIAIKEVILNQMGSEIANYYDLTMTDEKLVSNGNEMVDYDICRHIVGIHRSKLIFEAIDKRKLLEGSSAYQKELVREVINQIKLRRYGSVNFRQHPIMSGESFIFFPVPYYLFVLCVRMLGILNTEKARQLPCFSIITTIVNKGLAALSLLEDNFLDNAYPICRGVIELYVQFLLLENKPEAINSYNEFAKFDLDKSCISQVYSEKFNALYAERMNQGSKSKVDYLHFGWVDSISDYHSIVKTTPYSINGIVEYLESIYSQEGNIKFLSNLKVLYKMCHGYTHGSIGYSRYPLLHYFEIAMMLCGTLSHTYLMVCEALQQKEAINDINVVSELNKAYGILEQQYNKRTTENFEYYYKNQFRI